MARHDGKPLTQIARDHGLTIGQLRTVLRRHSCYCFGRVEPFMLKRIRV